jgi:hypothetical protein
VCNLWDELENDHACGGRRRDALWYSVRTVVFKVLYRYNIGYCSHKLDRLTLLRSKTIRSIYLAAPTKRKKSNQRNRIDGRSFGLDAAFKYHDYFIHIYPWMISERSKIFHLSKQDQNRANEASMEIVVCYTVTGRRSTAVNLVTPLRTGCVFY